MAWIWNGMAPVLLGQGHMVGVKALMRNRLCSIAVMVNSERKQGMSDATAIITQITLWLYKLSKCENIIWIYDICILNDIIFMIIKRYKNNSDQIVEFMS